MRSRLRHTLIGLGLLTAALACVREYDPAIPGNVDVIIVEGTLTDLPETQFVKLSRSRSDPQTGRFGSVPQSARVEVVVNGSEVLTLKEVGAGRFELPAGFRGAVGSSYQLRFQLGDGTRYASTPETLRAVPRIEKIYDRFNPQSLSETQLRGYTAANDLFVDTTDPAEQTNYYRWDWKVWEYQDWCAVGQYTDVYCSNRCWEIIYSYGNAVFADTYTNGRTIVGRRVAQIPFYQNRPSLVEIRQTSLSPEAYRYYKRLADQTEATGTLTDTPPATIVGNVRNLANERENVVGYFGASAVSWEYYWLERTSNTGRPIGLFVALNGRQPVSSAFSNPIPCVPGENRTPVKPEHWRD